MIIKNPEISKSLVVSTGHVSQQDVVNMEVQQSLPLQNIIVHPYEYGFYIYVPSEEENFKDYIDSLSKDGYSKEFIELLHETRKLGCRYLQLDRDGSEYSELKTLDVKPAEDERWFKNFYECPDCKVAWEDEWSCMCNDKCPECNKEIEPYLSEEMDKETGALKD